MDVHDRSLHRRVFVKVGVIHVKVTVIPVKDRRDPCFMKCHACNRDPYL